jgi:hypothetical protein
MATHFVTDQAKKLLDSFNARIAQTDAKGKITTWEKVVHDNITYYTHKSTEWKNEAFFKPEIKSTKLTFNIIKPGNKNISIKAYGYYHGHLIETFLNHFDDMFSVAQATAQPETGDKIS